MVPLSTFDASEEIFGEDCFLAMRGSFRAEPTMGGRGFAFGAHVKKFA